MVKSELSVLLAEKLAVYASDPSKRCKTKTGCRYSGKTLNLDTEGCLVGALLSEEDRLRADQAGIGDVHDLIMSAQSRKINIPKWFPVYADILDAFQGFHDIDVNWDIKGLSPYGQGNLKKIIERNLLDKTPFLPFLKPSGPTVKI